MKALPYLTLALCVAFLAFQQASVSSKTKTVTELQTRIDDAKSSGFTAPGRGRGSGPAGSGKSSRSERTGADQGLPQSVADLDLAELAEAMRAAESGGVPDLKLMMRVQTLLLKASPEELADLIARTADLDVPDEVKRSLIGQFIGGLAEHDPQAALELAFRSEYLDLDRQRWQFSESFSKWVKKDPAAAVAWFDQELAKGTFESKSLDRESDARIEFETAAVAALLESDPALARQRLLALPANERQAILNRDFRFHLNSENALAHARLVRETIPEDQQATVLAAAGRDFLQRQSYEDLAGYVEQVNASPAEREAIVEAAVERHFQRFGWESKTPTSADLATMQTFLQDQVPESADRITGEALAHYGGANQHFATAVELLTELHTAAPNDDALVGFLEAPEAHRAAGNQQALRDLATKITDPARRQAALDNLK